MKKSLPNLIVLALSVALVWLVYNNRVNLWLWLQTYHYNPPAEVARLADQANLTDYGKKLFYAAHPTVVTDRATFNTDCQAPISGKVVELGCYAANRHIYILKIDDASLNGEMTVIAAHEMLHAAYSYLPHGEQNRLNSELNAAAAQTSNQNLQTQLTAYKQSEPNDIVNELHSLLGTEISPLPATLEQYYAKYFVSRTTVVAADTAFTRVFDQSKAKLDNLQARISNLRAQMNNYRNRGNIPAYNALVPTINNLIDQYNKEVDYYNGLSRELRGTQSQSGTQ